MLPRPRLAAAREAIIACTRCPRLRAYCAQVARERKAAYRHDIYWGKPVPGFGDLAARVLIVGLAPAAHGANRTGRMFTGDVPGGSSDFLMRAMHQAGFASLPTSRAADDGLILRDAFLTAPVRCAPPDNKPTPNEIAACRSHLEAEVSALPNIRVVVALGRIGFDAVLKLMASRGETVAPKPTFAHGGVCRTLPPEGGSHGTFIVASYHPSRQNTQTGRLTPAMLDEVFDTARRLAEGGDPGSGIRDRGSGIGDPGSGIRESRPC